MIIKPPHDWRAAEMICCLFGLERFGDDVERLERGFFIRSMDDDLADDFQQVVALLGCFSLGDEFFNNHGYVLPVAVFLDIYCIILL